MLRAESYLCVCNFGADHLAKAHQSTADLVKLFTTGQVHRQALLRATFGALSVVSQRSSEESELI